ncbi:transposase [Gammaproteobacteria bacterium]|nr:transposase [Gammaproteobacteria bacterium]
MSYLDPKNDIVFKKIFGNNINLIKSLLNDLLMFEGDQLIDKLEYLTPEIPPEATDYKNSVVDVRCTDKNKRIFLVEMQMSWTHAFKQRVLFNASKVYVNQIQAGYGYEALLPVYSLNLVNQNYHPDKDQYYHRYQIVEVENTGERIEGMEFVFIELTKFLNNPNSTIKPRLRKIWLKLLSVTESSNIPKELLDDPLTAQAVELAEAMSYTPTERLAYDKFWDDVRRFLTVSAESEAKGLARGEIKGEARGEARGLARGLVEGKAEGLAEGKVEGKVEGKAEGKAEERLEIAKKLLALGIAKEAIAQASGLSIEEINAL